MVPSSFSFWGELGDAKEDFGIVLLLEEFFDRHLCSAVWKAILLGIIMWVIWCKRNSRTFEGEESSCVEAEVVVIVFAI